MIPKSVYAPAEQTRETPTPPNHNRFKSKRSKRSQTESDKSNISGKKSKDRKHVQSPGDLELLGWRTAGPCAALCLGTNSARPPRVPIGGEGGRGGSDSVFFVAFCQGMSGL